jgi:hypothetical protein
MITKTFHFNEIKIKNGEALNVPHLTPIMLHCQNAKGEDFYTQGYYVDHNCYFLNYANGLIEDLLAAKSKNTVLGWASI